MIRRLSAVACLALACGHVASSGVSEVACDDMDFLDGIDNDCDGVTDECESGIILCDCGGGIGLGTCIDGVGSGPCTLDCTASTPCGTAKGHAVCHADVVGECVAQPIACTTSLRTCLAQPGELDCSAGPPGQCIPEGTVEPSVCPLPGCRGGSVEADSDTDGDALQDCWESEGGIDIDGDGTLDLELPGADPNRKNLFVELDYMPGHRPLPEALARIEAAFREAPTPALQGVTPGIVLSFEPAMDEVPHADYLAFTGIGASACTGPARRAGGADFDQLKRDYFGTAAQRALPNPARELGRLARGLVYRYGIFGHHLESGPDLELQTGVSGCAEVPGDDFVVTLTASLDATLAVRGGTAHDCDAAVGSTSVFCQLAQSGVLMHELGHNLGLRHAGATDTPGCKPNYVSVMNYAFQFDLAFASRRLDYSRGRHIRLDESALSEPAGLGPDVAPGTFTNFGPSPVSVGCGIVELARPTFVFDVMAHSDGPLPINWNRDCQLVDSPLGPQLCDFIDSKTVAVDLNDFGFAECGPSPGETYDDHDDWAGLVFDVSHRLESAQGLRSGVAHETLTADIIHRSDSDGDSVSDVADNCPRLANPDQADRDDDALGDVCEAPREAPREAPDEAVTLDTPNF